MPGKAAKIIVSERQQVLLREFSKSRTAGKGVVQRATIILLGFAGLLNEAIAGQVGATAARQGQSVEDTMTGRVEPRSA